MDADHDMTPFRSFKGALLRFGKTTLRTSQGCFLLAEKSGMIDPLPGREVGKALGPHVDTYVLLRWGQGVGLHFITGKAHKPLTRGGGGDGAGPDHSFEGSVLHHLEMPNLRKGELALCNDAETSSWVGEGSIAESQFIARIVGRLAGFHASKKALNALSTRCRTSCKTWE